MRDIDFDFNKEIDLEIFFYVVDEEGKRERGFFGSREWNRTTQNGDQRRGEWEPQISIEIFSRCPKNTSKNKRIVEPKTSKPTSDSSTYIDYSQQ